MSTGYVNGGQRVTRKAHLCNYCDSSVPVGTLAHWWVWADHDTIDTRYAHPACLEMEETVNLWSDELIDPYDFRAVCEETWPGRPFPWNPT